MYYQVVHVDAENESVVAGVLDNIIVQTTVIVYIELVSITSTVLLAEIVWS